MKIFRSHIARIGTVGLLVAGLLMYLVRPVHAEQSAARFANWLKGAEYSTEVPGLDEELNRLRESGASISVLIQKASHIISESTTSASEEEGMEPIDVLGLYQVLLLEWNQYQMNSTMAAVPVSGSLKPLVPLQIDKYTGLNPERPVPGTEILSGETSDLENQVHFPDYNVQPLAGGTAIGAP